MLDFTPAHWYRRYALKKIHATIAIRGARVTHYRTRTTWEAYAPDTDECKFEANTLKEIKQLINGDLL